MEEINSDVADSIFSAPAPAQVTEKPTKSEETTKTPESPKDHELIISIGTSEKKGDGMGSHVTYTIRTKTTLPHFKKQEMATSRRFRDFLWLRTQLCETHKGFFIPPMPEKTALTDKFNTELVEYRRRELERFLQRVSKHPELSKSVDFLRFLDETELLQSQKEDAPKPTATNKIFGFFGSTVETISTIAQTATETEPWFEQMKLFVTKSDAQISALLKAITLMIKKKREMHELWQEIGLRTQEMGTIVYPSFESKESSETTQKSTKSNEAWSEISRVSDTVGSFWEKWADDDILRWEDVLRDQVRLLGAAKELLNARDERLAAFQAANKNYEKKKEVFEKQPSPPKAKEREEAQNKQKEAQLKYQEITSRARAELAKYLAQTNDTLQSTLVEFAQLNMNSGLLIVDQWKALMKHLIVESN